MGLFSNFFGGDSRKDLRAGKAAADKALQEGFDTANTRYDEASSLYDPYAQRGEQGAQAYYNALLGTQQQKQALYDNYTNDPGMQGMLGLQSNALLRQLNSQGSGTGGGKLALAGARVAQEGYGNFLNSLNGLGSQGLAATGAQSGIRQGQGDMAMGYGATRAGNAVNYANAMSSTRSAGLNNLLGLVGAGTRAVGAFYKPV